MYDDDTQPCPHCGGALGWLGRLGRLVWFQCRQCGLEVSQEDE